MVDTDKKMKFLTKLGLWITVVWIIAVGIIIFANYCTAQKMELNQWGDFLAGIAAPLALLWLVIGYFQQGEELRLNTRALELQKKEIANLAKNADRQATATEYLAQSTGQEAERNLERSHAEARLRIVAEGGKASGNTIRTDIVNIGAEVREVTVNYNGPYNLRLSPLAVWRHEQKTTLALSSENTKFEFPFCFEISYIDKFDNQRKQAYEMLGAHHLKETDQVVEYQ